MFDQLEGVLRKFKEIEARLSSGEFENPQELAEVSKEHSNLQKVVDKYLRYKDLLSGIRDAEIMLKDEDPEIKEMAKTELEALNEQKETILKELEIALVPPDPNDDKNVYLEIRAGTGGDEAALFVAELFRMYSRFAEKLGWSTKIISSSESGLGGFKEIIILIEGKGVYSHLKYECGTHRVQRVPVTETMGRVHTSAVTVAVLPEVGDIEIEVDQSDLRIDVYRASGAGGQHVNKTESAVRITHLSSGIVVQCQDSRSQTKNKEMAMKVLKARLYEKEQMEHDAQISQDRKTQVGSGDRSEKIRTYNFPQGRVTDHRIGLTLYKLENIVNGELVDIITPLNNYFQAEKLKALKQND